MSETYIIGTDTNGVILAAYINDGSSGLNDAVLRMVESGLTVRQIETDEPVIVNSRIEMFEGDK